MATTNAALNEIFPSDLALARHIKIGIKTGKRLIQRARLTSKDGKKILASASRRCHRPRGWGVIWGLGKDSALKNAPDSDDENGVSRNRALTS